MGNIVEYWLIDMGGTSAGTEPRFLGRYTNKETALAETKQPGRYVVRLERVNDMEASDE